MAKKERSIPKLAAAFAVAVCFGPIAAGGVSSGDEPRAREVMHSLQERFWILRLHNYTDAVGSKKPSSMWADGVVLSALNGAMRHDRQTYAPILFSFVNSLNRYWDFKERIPGYEPYPSEGNGHDKYYDDNAWVAIALLETYAETDRPQILQRATQVVDFVDSGWDDVLGGGIWWHEKHKGNSKNTCADAPAAVACLRLAQYLPPREAAERRALAKRIVDWTVANLQDEDALFADHKSALDGRVSHGHLTYNSALMIRAELGLYRATGNPDNLAEAKRIAAAGDEFVSARTGGYRDAIKWSHLLVEADLAMYRALGDQHLLERARNAVNADYAAWQEKPSDQLIDVASLARELWLFADLQTTEGKAFWAKIDGAPLKNRT